MTHASVPADAWDATGVVADRHLQYVLVNSFTSSPFSGNPAAVVMMTSAMADEWMRHVAREFNVSETSFLLPLATDGPAASPQAAAPATSSSTGHPPSGHTEPTAASVMGDGGGDGGDGVGDGGADVADYSLRWFTPNGTEVTLCGHATLAAAHVLIGREGSLHARDAGIRCVRFHTLSGVLTARVAPSRGSRAIELEFPMHEAADAEVDRPRLQAAFPGLELASVSKNSLGDFMVVCESEAAVRHVAIDWARLRDIDDCRGVILTASDAPWQDGAPAEGGQGAAQGGHDFVQRFFAPRVGIDEDPVTGSAFCTTGPYWAGRLGRGTLVGYQSSTRGGFVEVQVDAASRRCRLRGEAVATMCGFLLHHADTK